MNYNSILLAMSQDFSPHVIAFTFMFPFGAGSGEGGTTGTSFWTKSVSAGAKHTFWPKHLALILSENEYAQIPLHESDIIEVDWRSRQISITVDQSHLF